MTARRIIERAQRMVEARAPARASTRAPRPDPAVDVLLTLAAAANDGDHAARLGDALRRDLGDDVFAAALLRAGRRLVAMGRAAQTSADRRAGSR